MKKLMAAMALVAICGVGGCGRVSPAQEDAGAPPEMIAVQRVDIQRRLRETGRVEARRSVGVRSRLGGTVEELRVEPGDRVEAGAVLATLRVESNEQIRYLTTRVAVLQDSLTVASKSEALARLERRLLDGRTAEKELDVARAELELLQAKLELSRAQRAALERDGGGAQRIRRGLADVRAPISGVVLRRSVEIGEVVRASLGGPGGLGPELFRIGEIDELVVKSRVDQEDVNTVSVGAPVAIVLDALPREQFSGVVEHVSPAALAQPVGNDRVEYFVRILLQDRPARVRPGMTCKIDLVLAEASAVAALPVESVRARRQGADDPAVDADAPTWEVLLADGSTRTVELGLRDERWVEIRSGIEVGTEVVRHPARESALDLPDPTLLGRIGGG
jgi:RND family efflux transporter MFP subunit